MEDGKKVAVDEAKVRDTLENRGYTPASDGSMVWFGRAALPGCPEPYVAFSEGMCEVSRCGCMLDVSGKPLGAVDASLGLGVAMVSLRSCLKVLKGLGVGMPEGLSLWDDPMCGMTSQGIIGEEEAVALAKAALDGLSEEDTMGIIGKAVEGGKVASTLEEATPEEIDGLQETMCVGCAEVATCDAENCWCREFIRELKRIREAKAFGDGPIHKA